MALAAKTGSWYRITQAFNWRCIRADGGEKERGLLNFSNHIWVDYEAQAMRDLLEVLEKKMQQPIFHFKD